ncbi:MAG TPA: MmcQ/YjbR family DNA-binding protein [Gammaproteobacteria bacterium]|nr:MmcQ/YjbR family DNA-binding protein [Gammaproteobacteria bacterium]
MAKTGRANKLKVAMQALRKRALGYPEAWEDHPWGECAIKVRKKIFLGLSADTSILRVTTKLPQSYGAALLAPFAKPTHYGLGASGWVTCSFGPRDAIPMDSLFAWLDESYRAIAPKKLHPAIAGAKVKPKARGRRKTSPR